MTETFVSKQDPVGLHSNGAVYPQTSQGKIQERTQGNPTLMLGIGTAVPEFSASQDEACAFMEKVLTASVALENPEGKAPLGLLRRIYAHSGIECRHSVLGDYMKDDPANFVFFPKNWALAPSPGTAARMAAY